MDSRILEGYIREAQLKKIDGVISVFEMKIGKRNIQNTGNSQSNIVLFLRQQADAVLDWINVGKGSEVYASNVRVFLLVCIIIMWRIVHYKYGYTYAVAMNLVLFLTFVAWIPMEKEACYDEPLHPIMRWWLILCLLQFISDILLKKEFGYSEFICVWMLLCFGLLYRAWKRMEKPYLLLDEFANAVEILFFMNVIFCLFGDARNAKWTDVMTGTRTNPNPFAMGVALCVVVFLFRLVQIIYKKKKWYCCFGACIGLVFGIWMLKEAKSRNAWFILSVIIFFVIMFFLCKYARELRVFTRILGGVILLAAFLVVIIKGNKIFSIDIIEKIDFLLTGRISTWQAYISKINVIGNTKLLIFDGESLAPHNGIIMLMYRYGFFTGLVGIIFLFNVIWSLWISWKKEVIKNTRNLENAVYTFLIVGILIAYLFPSMLDTCDEGIMGWINWFAFYFMMGYAIQENRNDKK